MGFFDKMFSGLTKTRKNIEELEEVFRNYDIDSEDFYDELEEMLIMADVGGETTAQIMMDYKRILLRRYINKGKAAKEAFVGYMQDMLGNMDTKLKLDTKPSVILMVGVNGVGKTTTIGKLSASLKAEGKMFCFVPAIPSARQQPSSWACGQSAPERISSATRRAAIRQRWCMTDCARRKRAERMSLLSTPPAVCTIRQTS